MRKKIIKTWLFILALVLALAGLKWGQELCVERTARFLESFGNTDYKDPVSSVAHWGEGYVTLNRLGANFDVTIPSQIPIWINTVAAGDFDLDGWPDFVGSSSSYSNVLAFLRNMGPDGQIGSFRITHWIDGSQGNIGGTPIKGVQNANIDGDGHCGMTCGDYDRDGDLDFLFISSSTNSPYTPERIWLYENKLIDGGTRGPSIYFTQTNLTGSFSGLVKGIAWSSTIMQTIDFDGDGDVDVVMGNRAGEVLLLRNTRSRQIGQNTFIVEPLLINTGWGGRGVSTVSVGNFDADIYPDIIVGSVSTADLRYYKNDGTGHFTLYRSYNDPSKVLTNTLYDGAGTVSICRDFDMDGDLDLMVGTDNWNYDTDGKQDSYAGTGLGGFCFYFKNTNGDFTSKLIFNGRTANPVVWDFDLGAYFDYDQDGDDDFFIADGNHSQKYYIFNNLLANVYNLHGVAQSTDVTPLLNPQQHAITKVRITDIGMRVVGGSSDGLSVSVYVSNNDGVDWELYQRFAGSQIRNYSDLPVYTFKNFGSKMRWRASLDATEDQMAEYTGASYETPRIDQIEFEYTYVERREYSRTSTVAATIVDGNNQTKKLIIAGSFYYPGWQGYLRAYDVTGLATQNNPYSILRTVSTSAGGGSRTNTAGVNILWDAGDLLQNRAAASRTIYTALPGGSGLTRANFVESNAATLGPILQDVNGNNSGLISYVRGTGRYWKLGDINHSNPIISGPPDGSVTTLGASYQAFMQTWQNRRKVVYVGANDGMVHCFDAVSGEEIWGFIPYNLLPKLKNMWAVDSGTGARYFRRDNYVDGTPKVADVQVGNVWKTVLICGQGPGNGSAVGGGYNYYFALDVTDPTNPQPLWEFTNQGLGETWSVPDVGKINIEGLPAWAAFMGSGYDNNPNAVCGNVFYGVKIADGSMFWSYTAADVDTSARYANIYNAIPGSPALFDQDSNGFADKLYFADLDGRLYRVNVSVNFTSQSLGGGRIRTSWDNELAAIYTDPSNYPIITKPLVVVNAISGMTTPRIYFGTGGDDRAPATATYSFIALLEQTNPAVEWFLGDPSLLGQAASKDKGDLGQGEKVWADPVHSDYIVYCSTLQGSIESVDPCLNLQGMGKLYGRFTQSVAGTMVGGTAFTSGAGSLESLALASKSRAAVTVGERSRTDGGARKRDVYIQEYNSTIQKLEQPVGAMLKVKSWREVYKIIR